MLWDSENGSSASVPEQRLRVEREREIACYLLLVSSLQQECCPNIHLSFPTWVQSADLGRTWPARSGFEHPQGILD